MKIIVLTHKLVRNDGQGRVNFELVRSLAASGLAVHIIADEVSEELLEEGSVDWSRARHGVLPSAILRNLWFAAHSGYVLRQVRRPGDVVIVNGAITFGRSDINAVHFVHGGWRASPYYDPGVGFTAYYQRLYTYLNARWERLALRATRYAVAVSAKVADELVAISTPRAKIEVIPNGVDTEEFRPGQKERGTLGLPDDVPLALFAGGLGTPRKNLETALRAVAEIPGLHFAVAGGSADTPYPALARTLGIADRVHFLGFRSDIPAVMQACDLFVFPSRYEPFGLVIIEAMASGLPVVTCRTAGAAQLVGKECGVVIDEPNDVGALAKALRAVLNDLENGRAMSGAARRVAMANDWSTMGEKYRALCERVVAGRQV